MCIANKGDYPQWTCTLQACIYSITPLTDPISYSTVVLCIRDHEGLDFSGKKKNHPKTNLTIPSWHLGSIG